MKLRNLLFCLGGLSGSLLGEPIFTLPSHDVSSGPALEAILHLPPLGYESHENPTAPNASLVALLEDSLAVRAKDFLGGNNEPLLRFRGFGAQNVPSSRSVDFLIDEVPFGWTDGWSYFGAFPASFASSSVAVPTGGAVPGAQSMGGAFSLWGHHVRIPR